MRLTKGLGFGGANILPGPGIYHAYHFRFPKDTLIHHCREKKDCWQNMILPVRE